jgi:hypothetical protein
VLIAILLSLAGCAETTTGLAPPCIPDAPEADVASAAPGDTVRLLTHPLLDDFDTTVLVGGTPAEVLGVSRDGCEDFDACLVAEACSACGDCDACGALLTGCVESVRVRVPDLADGAYAVTVWSKYGESRPGVLDVAAAPLP